MPNEETELNKFLEENGVTNDEVEKPEEDRLYDFSEKKPVTEAKADETEDDEEEVPFHKNPKVLKFIEREVAKRIPEVKTEPQVQVHSQDEEDPLSDVLTRIFGNDTPEKLSTVKDFKKALGGMKEEAKLEVLREIYAEREQETQAEIQAQNEVSDALDDIEETFNIDLSSGSPMSKKLRNDFIDFVKRVAPKDSNGEIVYYPDWRETFSLFKERNQKSSSNDRAKDIANRSISNTNVADTTQVVDSFDDMEKWLETLPN